MAICFSVETRNGSRKLNPDLSWFYERESFAGDKTKRAEKNTSLQYVYSSMCPMSYQGSFFYSIISINSTTHDVLTFFGVFALFALHRWRHLLVRGKRLRQSLSQGFKDTVSGNLGVNAHYPVPLRYLRHGCKRANVVRKTRDFSTKIVGGALQIFSRLLSLARGITKQVDTTLA